MGVNVANTHFFKVQVARFNSNASIDECFCAIEIVPGHVEGQVFGAGYGRSGHQPT